MKYFAYGSNLLSGRINERVPSAVVHSKGHLRKYKLMFHKVSVDGSGKCDVFLTNDDNDVTYGIIFEIPEDEKVNLDKAEGLGYGYDEKIVSIFSEKDKIEIEAVTYFATNINSELEPYHWYKNFVLEGAVENNLPEHHVEFIRNIQSIDDLDKERARLNEAILTKKYWEIRKYP